MNKIDDNEIEQILKKEHWANVSDRVLLDYTGEDKGTLDRINRIATYEFSKANHKLNKTSVALAWVMGLAAFFQVIDIMKNLFK